MTDFFDDELGEYLVLANEDGQHSLWRPFKEAPVGWTAVGPRGSRVDCLAYIDRCWRDARSERIEDTRTARAQTNTKARERT